MWSALVILPVLSRECCTCGTMCTLCAGSRMLWWSLLIVVASAHSPNALPKVLFDFIPVGIDGSEGLKALAVAPVLLIADGMLPSSTPNRKLIFLLVCCCLQLALFLSTWLCGRVNVTCLSSYSAWLDSGAY